jgi:tetratricopeptide (TPR) repeat protein
MARLPPLAQQALDCARRGDMAGAIAAAVPALRAHPDDYDLRMFMVRVHAQALDLDGALAHAERALAVVPGDGPARIEVVRLLIGLDRLDEAEGHLARPPDLGIDGFRLQAMILARRGRPGKAIPILRQVLAAAPGDDECWATLGACLLATAQPGPAADAFARAGALRPDVVKYREKMIEAAVAAGDGEQALASARAEAAVRPGDPDAMVTVARLELLLQRHGDAETTLRRILSTHPDHVPALLGLSDLLERNNALDELAATIERIARLDPANDRLPLLRARMALRRGQFEEALTLARAAPAIADRGAREEIIARAEDRLGHFDAAFEAFEAMNRDSELSEQTIANRAAALRQMIDERASLTVPDWADEWTGVAAPEREEPVFLIGFPRSGTTLLDTFLMGHPALCIAEEKPLLLSVSEKLGAFADIARLGDAEVAALRDTYWAATAQHVPDLGQRTLVDKYPLGAIDLAIIHRLFPTARIIFAERHPYDVALSCFMTRFQPTPALISFSTLGDGAKLYDRVMHLWSRSRVAFPLAVHELRYERLVENPEPEMRALIAFLGLDWDSRAASHEASASERSTVTSASYAQVSEPLYRRSIGRWRHYERHLAPILPILRPWAEAMGYDV